MRRIVYTVNVDGERGGQDYGRVGAALEYRERLAAAHSTRTVTVEARLIESTSLDLELYIPIQAWGYALAIAALAFALSACGGTSTARATAPDCAAPAACANAPDPTCADAAACDTVIRTCPASVPARDELYCYPLPEAEAPVGAAAYRCTVPAAGDCITAAMPGTFACLGPPPSPECAAVLGQSGDPARPYLYDCAEGDVL